MTVAYYLILDHKRRRMLGSSPIMHATQQQLEDRKKAQAQEALQQRSALSELTPQLSTPPHLRAAASTRRCRRRCRRPATRCGAWC